VKSYLVSTPKLIQRIFPKRVWHLPNTKNEVYLSFDDGPIPEITPWVLDTLRSYNAKATFFCIGDNVRKYHALFNRISSEGHAVGNHTFHHLNGWKTSTRNYLSDVSDASEAMENITQFFRPPYGKLKSKHSKILQKQGYKIIMWDVLSADFDASVSPEQCLQNVLKHIQAGSIVVFHDSLKAEKNLRYSLPKVLQYISAKGWKCRPIYN